MIMRVVFFALVLFLCMAKVTPFMISCSQVQWAASKYGRQNGIIHRRPFSSQNIHTLANSALRWEAMPSDDPKTESRSIHTLSIPLPLGLTLEEMDISDPSYGVVIVAIAPEGNASKINLNAFSNISQSGSVGDHCICIRDKIMSVNGTPCHDQSLDTVIQLIKQCELEEVTIELGRIEHSTILTYSKGRSIAAKPGESYGFLAQKCGVEIEYECRTGNCLTCSRWMEFPDKSNVEKTGKLHRRSILHCVGTVPRNYEWLRVLDESSS